MKFWLAGFILIATTAFAGVPEPSPSPNAAHRYYVNFDHGDDAADGRTPARAWRHAPGDRNVVGRPARMILHAGDVILFAAGVHYRGELKLNGGGEAGNPVVLTSAPGAGPAIIDGSDPVAGVRPCRSANDCAGVAGWEKFTRVDFAEPLPAGAALFTDVGLLFPAQYPAPADLFNSDDVSEYLEVDGRDLARGSAPLPGDLARTVASAGERQISLHIQGNLVVTRPILGLDGKLARFDPTGLHFYTDRPERIAVMGHPALVNRRGEFGLIEGRRAAVVYMPAEAHKVFAARGRGGVNISSQSHVVVRDLAFENMTDDGVSSASGVAIFKSAVGSDIKIERNRFRNFHMPMGAGPIAVNFTAGLSIIDNDIHAIAFGSGMRLSKDSDVVIKGNLIARIGRTGIMVMDVERGLVAENTVRDAKGVHGNGMSAYLDNRDVKFIANTVIDAPRPITFEGGSRTGDNDLVFANNLLVGSGNPHDAHGVRTNAPDSRAALTSWGDDRKVLIENNLILGGQQGLELSDTDTAVSIRHNVLNGDIIVKHKVFQRPGSLGYIPPGWSLADNRAVSYSPADNNTKAMSGLNGSIQDAIRGGGAWQGLCSSLAPGSVAGTKYQGAIGATLRCPRSPAIH